MGRIFLELSPTLLSDTEPFVGPSAHQLQLVQPGEMPVCTSLALVIISAWLVFVLWRSEL